MEILYRPIGICYTPFKDLKDVPIQTKFGVGTEGRIVLFKEYEEGLKDLSGFSHIILISHLHKSKGYTLKLKPFIDNELRGVFATRSPRRPNPIGLSIVRLEKIERNILYIRDVDLVDGTPILDIKPYVPEIDSKKVESIGWMKGKFEGMK